MIQTVAAELLLFNNMYMNYVHLQSNILSSLYKQDNAPTVELLAD